MQEMSPAELEVTCGGVTFQEVGSELGKAVDAFIAAAKTVGAKIAELGQMIKDFIGSLF